MSNLEEEFRKIMDEEIEKSKLREYHLNGGKKMTKREKTIHNVYNTILTMLIHDDELRESFSIAIFNEDKRYGTHASVIACKIAGQEKMFKDRLDPVSTLKEFVDHYVEEKKQQEKELKNQEHEKI